MNKMTVISACALATFLSACGGGGNTASSLNGNPSNGNRPGNYLPNRPGNDDTSAAAEFSELLEDINAQDDTASLDSVAETAASRKYALFGTASGTVPGSTWNVLGGGTYEGIKVGALTFEDSENGDRVVEYIESATPGPLAGTFMDSVTVRITRGASDDFRANVKTVIDRMNRLLPRDRRLMIGPDVDPLPDPHNPYGYIGDNEIIVANIENLTERGYSGRMYPLYRVDGSRQGAYLAIDNGVGSTYRFTNLIAHEMLHALAFDGHVSPSIFSEALLNTGGKVVDTTNAPSRILAAPKHQLGVLCHERGCSRYHPTIPAIEGEAVWALYHRFATTGVAQKSDISVDNLGFWGERAYRFFGIVETTDGDVVFGVDFRFPSQWARPWFGGVENVTYLGGSGTAVWNGAILGVSPSLHPVAGKTRVSVNLETATGHIDFTDLRTDDGSGVVRWGEGQLNYAIGMNATGIYRTGGSEGELIGVFLGEQHEGVGGTLEREDLVAAFGAKR